MILAYDFSLAFGGRLNQDNRLVAMASFIPWAEVEEAYIRSLGDTNQGNDAFPVRLVLGSLIIKERLGLSDVETIHYGKSLSAILSSDCMPSMTKPLSIPPC